MAGDDRRGATAAGRAPRLGSGVISIGEEVAALRALVSRAEGRAD